MTQRKHYLLVTDLWKRLAITVNLHTMWKQTVPSTEDYEAPDQVVPTDSLDRSKNEKEQTYTVSIKSYVLKKKNKKLRKVHCKICNASCEGVKSLNEHHRSEHDIQFCSDCGKGFATQTVLDMHSYVHGELNFVCETCGKGISF